MAAVRAMMSCNASRLRGRRPWRRQQRCATFPGAMHRNGAACFSCAAWPITKSIHVCHDAQTCKRGINHRPEAMTSRCLEWSCLLPAQELRSIQAALAARPQEAAAVKKQRPKKERPGTHSNYMPGMRMSAAAR